MRPAVAEHRDDISLGFQPLFNLITNQNLPAVAGTETALTLSQLWMNIHLRNLADVPLTLRFGGVFTLNNVAPWSQAMTVGGAPASRWRNGMDPLPVFQFLVPRGMPGEAAVAQLLNVFSIRFYNADFSEQLLNFSITPVVVGDGNRVNWTPTAAQWDLIKAAPGVKHWFVQGALRTGVGAGQITTGPYWSGSVDFEIA